MRVLKKLGCALLIAGMLVTMTGCGDEKKASEVSTEKVEQVKKATDEMLYVGSATVNDVKEFYFIDGNGQIKTYSGYYSMKDFKNGLSIVEVTEDNTRKQMLIDAEGKEIVKCKKIFEKKDAGISIYVTSDENDKMGIYSCKGEKIADCKYDEIFIDSINVSRSEGAIIGKCEDTSLDIYSWEGKYICSVKAGYAGTDYGYEGVYVDSYFGDTSIIEVKYGEIVKLYDVKTGKELDYEKFKDYRNGYKLTDAELVIYNDNYEVIKEIDFAKEGKQYESVSGTHKTYIYAKYEGEKKNMIDVFNGQGELICTGEDRKIDAGRVEANGKEYILWYKEDGISYIDETGKEVFFKASGAKLEQCDVKGLFFLRSDEGVKIYNTKDFTPYDDVLYTGGQTSGLFLKDKYYMFNGEGKVYEMDKIEGVDVYDYRILQNGYVTYCTMNGDERLRYILDVNKGKTLEIPFGASFCENVPCYKVDNVYYDYNGKVVYDGSSK